MVYLRGQKRQCSKAQDAERTRQANEAYNIEPRIRLRKPQNKHRNRIMDKAPANNGTSPPCVPRKDNVGRLSLKARQDYSVTKYSSSCPDAERMRQARQDLASASRESERGVSR